MIMYAYFFHIGVHTKMLCWWPESSRWSSCTWQGHNVSGNMAILDVFAMFIK